MISWMANLIILSEWEEKPQTPSNNAMTQKHVRKYELGRRLVKGPRRSGGHQAAPCEKLTTGKISRKSRMWRKKPKQKEPPQSPCMFNILQLNICGLGKKKTELAKVLNEHKIHIALLQETLHNNIDLHITGYTNYACDCKGCRGIVTYIRNDIVAECEHLPQDDSTDVQKIAAWHQERKYTIYNVYSPPPATCHVDDLKETMYHNTLVAGDFNGHSPQWGYPDTNRTGQYLEELHQSTNLVIMQNENSPATLLHRAHNTLSRPDLTLVSANLEDRCTLKVLPCIGSDHKPILTTVNNKQESLKTQEKFRWNFRKANWSSYKSKTDEEFMKMDLTEINVNSIEEKFTTIVLHAAKRYIPRGYMKKYKPFWNKDIQEAVTNRQVARDLVETHPTPENKTDYNKATAKAKLVTASSKRENWEGKCSSLDLRKDGNKAWLLLHNLSGDKRRTNPQPLPEGETDKKRSEKLNKYFASINKSRTDKENDKAILSELKQREKERSDPASIFTEQLTTEELDFALKSLKGKKSPGPDKIHNEMLKNLGQTGKKVLLHLINCTWAGGTLPKSWKNAYIAPILKKDKDPKEPKSYRPISLTSCVGKVCERMINRRLYWWLEHTGILTEYQAGFRTNSRTEDQLFRLCQNIQDGYQDGLHTTAVFIDLQQAYDRVWRKGLMIKMQRHGIKGNMYKWIKGFLQERTIQTKVNNSLSSKQVLEDGLPQGSALSCTLFLLFVNDMVQDIKVQKALYADDLVIWHTGKYTRQSARHLNQDLQKLNNYTKKWKITINPTKTVYSVFTMSAKVAKQTPEIKINGQKAMKEDQPTYLGVQLDSRLTMNKHVANLKKKSTKRLGLLKRLASTNWGADMNTLRSLYIGYIRSVLDYNQCLLISCSKTTQKSLDRIQNNAVRLICGGMKSSPTSACEITSNIEPLGLRREKATLELQERCLRMPDRNPAQKLVTSWKRKNRLKHQSILHHAHDLNQKCHLPELRAKTTRVSEVPPNTSLPCPEIRTHLIDSSVNKKSDIIDLKNAANTTISSYPDNWIHIYTDGSAFKATVNAGYGALICLPDGSSEELSAACGSVCSNYEAELLGIEASCKHLTTLFKNNPSHVANTVIFTDSMSALQAIEDKSSKSEIIKLLLEIKKLLTNSSIRLVLQWIPGHTDLPGNDKADRLAKQGSSSIQPERATTLQTAKMVIHQNYREEWMNLWARGVTGRVVYEHMSTTKPRDPIKQISRKEQCTIFRLRTQHIPLNMHLNRLNPEHPPMCQLCDEPYETVDHIMFNCTKLSDLRRQFLPAIPHVTNSLYSTRSQLKNTATYFNMALGRRATAHKPLD